MHKNHMLERAYCKTPIDCQSPIVAVLGAGIGLDFAHQLEQYYTALGHPLSPNSLAIFDAGGLDLLTHLSNTGLPRLNLIQCGLERVGGKTALWGMCTPRPPKERLIKWPYPLADLQSRFQRFECAMGVPEPIPLSGRNLEGELIKRLGTFVDHRRVLDILPAPLAINAYGHRWSALDHLAEVTEHGISIVPHARCTRLEAHNGYIEAIHGAWHGKTFICRPQIVVLAVGAENVLPLLDNIRPSTLELHPADHIRMDLSGWLESDHFHLGDANELGVGVLNMDCRSEHADVAYHLEIKVAPKPHWKHYMPSGDNLQTGPYDRRILVQVQAIAEMHNRLPTNSLIRDHLRIHPQLSLSDVCFHAEIGTQMYKVAREIGLTDMHLTMRPLLTNHHLYGLFRIGKGVNTEFLLEGFENLYILPPAAFPDVDDDANPMLKSRVLTSYAVEAIAARLMANDHKSKMKMTGESIGIE